MARPHPLYGPDLTPTVPSTSAPTPSPSSSSSSLQTGDFRRSSPLPAGLVEDQATAAQQQAKETAGATRQMSVVPTITGEATSVAEAVLRGGTEAKAAVAGWLSALAAQNDGRDFSCTPARRRRRPKGSAQPAGAATIPQQSPAAATPTVPATAAGPGHQKRNVAGGPAVTKFRQMTTSLQPATESPGSTSRPSKRQRRETGNQERKQKGKGTNGVDHPTPAHAAITAPAKAADLPSAPAPGHMSGHAPELGMNGATGGLGRGPGSSMLHLAPLPMPARSSSFSCIPSVLSPYSAPFSHEASGSSHQPIARSGSWSGVTDYSPLPMAHHLMPASHASYPSQPPLPYPYPTQLHFREAHQQYRTEPAPPLGSYSPMNSPSRMAGDGVRRAISPTTSTSPTPRGRDSTTSPTFVYPMPLSSSPTSSSPIPPAAHHHQQQLQQHGSGARQVPEWRSDQDADWEMVIRVLQTKNNNRTLPRPIPSRSSVGTSPRSQPHPLPLPPLDYRAQPSGRIIPGRPDQRIYSGLDEDMESILSEVLNAPASPHS